jgi:hypothetical protein
MLSLDNVDVRTLSNSMRAVFSEQRTQQLVPLGNSNSILITAPAAMATNVIEMLRRADEEAAKAQQAAISAPKPAEQAPPPK